MEIEQLRKREEKSGLRPESKAVIDSRYLRMLTDEPLDAAALVLSASRRPNFVLRRCLAELYRSGYFGRRDVVAGYAWTMAAFDGSTPSYEDLYRLAEVQQYYEFFLTEGERAEALRTLDEHLPKSEVRQFVPGIPFNGGWWGYGDDEVPARPGERDFKEQFVRWLEEGRFSPDEIAGILSRCRPSDGPTREERIEACVNERMRSQGFTEDPVTRRWTKTQSE